MDWNCSSYSWRTDCKLKTSCWLMGGSIRAIRVGVGSKYLLHHSVPNVMVKEWSRENRIGVNWQEFVCLLFITYTTKNKISVAFRCFRRLIINIKEAGVCALKINLNYMQGNSIRQYIEFTPTLGNTKPISFMQASIKILIVFIKRRLCPIYSSSSAVHMLTVSCKNMYRMYVGRYLGR